MEAFKEFFAQPFRSDMSALHWFAFIAFVVLCLAIQGMLLRHIRGI